MGDHHHGPAKGLSRWLYTTNHKDIGTMYLWFSFAMFLLGGAFAMVIRAELFQPGMQLVEPGFFNQMTTLHGLVMVFGAIMPSFVGLANWLIPMMIGAPDMALPRMNNWSFWILPPAFLMLASTLLMEGGAPAFGVISQIIPAFSRKPLFGYASMVYATAAIAFLSFIVWAHHMYTVGMPVAGELFFMYATMLIAVPTGVKVFNWVTTMWRGAMTFETPMLFSIGFLVLFTIGGFTGLMLSIAPADFQYHDTYFVVAHFHYVMVAGAVFSMTAAIYFWLPKWTGRMYNETMGKVHFWVSFIGFNVTFFPQHFVGLAGMPRRIPDYALQFADFNMMSSIGAFIYGASQLLFLYNVIAAIVAGEKVSDEKVWDGAEGLEWTLPSPPPYHTFETPPKIEEQPAH